MSECYASLSHHFHEISKGGLEPEIPAHAEDDDLAAEMAALERIINAQHAGPAPPSAILPRMCSVSAVCTRAAIITLDKKSRSGELAAFERHSGVFSTNVHGRKSRRQEPKAQLKL
jgi:hypothetical protein